MQTNEHLKNEHLPNEHLESIPTKIIPSNFGPIKNYNGHAKITGGCNDTMEIWIIVNNGIIKKSSFTTDGCSSSVRCGSIAALLAIGEKIDEIEKVDEDFVLTFAGSIDQEYVHCAELAVKTLRKAVDNYKSNKFEQKEL